ncbi:MAG TPA: MFS transporter [Solirubrobacteraceae bacterium]|jgi:MFS family permease
MPPAPDRTPARAWIVWSAGVGAYVAAVFHRASFGVSAVDAQERFGATAAALSLFVVLQIGVYASLQIPVGALLDRLGPRRLIAAGAVVMAGGQFLMATSHLLAPAVGARALIGAGDAMTFISVLRLVSLWFAPRRVPVMSQVTGLFGQVGQIAAAYPLVALLHGAGWSTSFAVAGGLGLGVGLLVLAAVRDAPPGAVAAVPLAPAEVRAHVGHAWREAGTRLGLWTHFVTQFPATVFALLWGYPFLVVGEGRTPAEAGVLLTVLVIVGMAIGPVLGSVAGRWPYRRSVPTLAIVGSTAAAWTLVIAWPGRAPLAVLVLLVVAMATNGPGSLVGFDYARTENAPERIGSATGIVNVGGFVASLTAILLIGLVLDRLHPGAGRESYTLDDFRIAMSVQYLLWAIGLAGVLRARRRLRAVRGVSLDPFPRAVARVTRARRRARRDG